jgi:hypothetical protein
MRWFSSESCYPPSCVVVPRAPLASMLRRVALLGFALAVFCVCPNVRAEGSDEDVQACATAYEQAQVARNNGKLVDAQEQLRICVQDACPDFVKTDCGQWLSDIKRDMPSVIFAPVDSEGNELIEGVTVTVDGKEVSLDGRPVEIDPGQHDVTYEYEGETKTDKVAVRQGEKNRVIKLEVVTDKDSDGDGILDSKDQCPSEVGVAPSGCPAVVAPPPTPGPDKKLRLGAYIAWGVGGAGLVVGGIFGYLGYSAEQDALDECEAPKVCTEGRKRELIDGVDRKNLVANISLFGVGLTGAATGTVLFFLSQPSAQGSTNSAMNVGVQPLDDGGVLSLSGAF